MIYFFNVNFFFINGLRENLRFYKKAFWWKLLNNFFAAKSKDLSNSNKINKEKDLIILFEIINFTTPVVM